MWMRGCALPFESLGGYPGILREPEPAASVRRRCTHLVTPCFTRHQALNEADERKASREDVTGRHLLVGAVVVGLAGVHSWRLLLLPQQPVQRHARVVRAEHLRAMQSSRASAARAIVCAAAGGAGPVDAPSLQWATAQMRGAFPQLAQHTQRLLRGSLAEVGSAALAGGATIPQTPPAAADSTWRIDCCPVAHQQAL